jgi:hypothetical protein
MVAGAMEGVEEENHLEDMGEVGKAKNPFNVIYVTN